MPFAPQLTSGAACDRAALFLCRDFAKLMHQNRSGCAALACTCTVERPGCEYVRRRGVILRAEPSKKAKRRPWWTASAGARLAWEIMRAPLSLAEADETHHRLQDHPNDTQT